jgi:transposase-like protein
MTERESYWRRAVGRQACSGGSIAAFCEAEGVSTASFYAWRKRLWNLGRRQRRGGDPTPRLVPLTVAPPPQEQLTAALPRVEVVLPSGVRLCVPDGVTPQTLRDVLAALEPARC